MKKRIINVILLLAVTAFANFGLVNTALAGGEEDEWITGAIVKINFQRRLIVVSDERTSEEESFTVHSKTLSKLSLGDKVSIHRDGWSGMALSIKNIYSQ